MSSSARMSQYQPQGEWIRRSTRLAILIRDSFSCLYCGIDLRSAEPAEVTLDHLISRKRGGTNDATNLITACRRCNCGRGAKPWRQYAPDGAIPRIKRHRRRTLNRKLALAILRGEAPNPLREA